jgi:hypothetical protein
MQLIVKHNTEIFYTVGVQNYNISIRYSSLIKMLDTGN